MPNLQYQTRGWSYDNGGFTTLRGRVVKAAGILLRRASLPWVQLEGVRPPLLFSA